MEKIHYVTESDWSRERGINLKLGVLLVKPEGKPVGLVQLVHGICDHKEKYLPLMEHLDEAQPGFRHIFLKPHVPEGCGYFCAEHETPMGRLIVHWNGSNLTVTLPEGASATLTWKNEIKELSAGEHIL